MGKRTVLEWAEYYVSKGFSVVPVPYRSPGKRPIIKWEKFQKRLPTPEELRQWFSNGSSNIAIVCGELSGLAVVDLDSAKAVEFAKENGFEATPLVKTQRGYHCYYRWQPGVRNFQKHPDLPDIDLRGEGGLAIAPPSVHASGAVYQWGDGQGLDDRALVPIPSRVLAKSEGEKTPLKELYEGVGAGERNQSLARLAGSWVSDGLSLEDCVRQAYAWNTKNNPPLDVRELERTVRSIYEKHHRDRGVTHDPDTLIYELIDLSTVTPQNVEWLWPGYIPYGKLTLFDGDPGRGKSHLALDILSRVSRGADMPDGSPTEKGAGIILTTEDGAADTIVPRLLAAGADLSRISHLSSITFSDGVPRPPTIGDITHLERACKETGARLLVVDPFMAHLDASINAHRDQDVRRALNGLQGLADKLGIAVILIRHLNKSEGKSALQRGGGSIGIIGAARTGFLIAEDPEDKTRRVFACTKSNLAPTPPALSYRIEGVEIDGVKTSRVVWGGVSAHDAQSLLSVPTAPDECSALDEAKEFLNDLLEGGGMEATAIMNEAKRQGISNATLRRAKSGLRINVKKAGFGGKWTWFLPLSDDSGDTRDTTDIVQDAQKTPEDAQIPNTEHLEHLSIYGSKSAKKEGKATKKGRRLKLAEDEEVEVIK